jgi:hypothetical protein
MGWVFESIGIRACGHIQMIKSIYKMNCLHKSVQVIGLEIHISFYRNMLR